MSPRLIFGLSLLLWAGGCRTTGGGGDDPGPEALDVEELPATLQVEAAETSELDAYSCDGAGEAPGPERLYRIDLAEAGFFLATVTAGSDQVAGVALLGSLDGESCLDHHATTVGALLEPGEYVVAVEQVEGGAEGAITLQMALTTTADLEGLGVAPQLAADALTIFGNAWRLGASRRAEYVIVDFTLHSAEPREWVVDLSTGELLWHLRVAHGRRSTDGVDLAQAVTFSNVPESNQSSLGLMRAGGTYVGVFGDSFRIEGLEPGFNDNVCLRDIVMHPWSAMNDEYVDRCGWARPSLGCPAIDDSLCQPVRDRLARPDGAPLDMGALMLFWAPDTEWQAASRYLHPTDQVQDLLDQLEVECDSSVDSEPTPPLSTDYACD